MLHVISVVAENRRDTIMRVTRVVKAHGLNLLTLAARASADQQQSEITFRVDAEPDRIRDAVRKIRRVIRVLSSEIREETAAVGKP